MLAVLTAAVLLGQCADELDGDSPAYTVGRENIRTMAAVPATKAATGRQKSRWAGWLEKKSNVFRAFSDVLPASMGP